MLYVLPTPDLLLGSRFAAYRQNSDRTIDSPLRALVRIPTHGPYGHSSLQKSIPGLVFCFIIDTMNLIFFCHRVVIRVLEIDMDCIVEDLIFMQPIQSRIFQVSWFHRPKYMSIHCRHDNVTGLSKNTDKKCCLWLGRVMIYSDFKCILVEVEGFIVGLDCLTFVQFLFWLKNDFERNVAIWIYVNEMGPM